MALAVIVDLISIGVTTASIASSFAASQQNNNARFRVRAALNGNYDGGTLSGAGGGAPDIRVFNEQLDFLGATYNPGYVGDGGFRDYSVDQGNSQEPTFALFTANDDAICIAYATVTYPSDMKGSWVGSWGQECGKAWYYSDVYYDGHKVDCTWIDANGDATDVTAFHVHWPDFDGNRPHSSNIQDYCNNVRTMNFQTGNDPGTIYAKRSDEPTSNAGPEKHILQRRRARDTWLVTSRIPGQSAVDLCASPTSFGPDFANEIEGMYCDMGTKELMPLCPQGSLTLTGLTGGCFDLGNLTTIVDGVVAEVKEFSSIIDWAEGQAF